MKIPRIPKGLFRRLGFPGEPMEHEFEIKPCATLGFNQSGQPECFEWFSAQLAQVTTGVGGNLVIASTTDFARCLSGNVFTAPASGFWRFALRASAIAVDTVSGLGLRITRPVEAGEAILAEVNTLVAVPTNTEAANLQLEHVCQVNQGEALRFKFTVAADPITILGDNGLIFGQRIG